MRRWSAWPSFPISTHLHEGHINCRRQGPFFCRCLTLFHPLHFPPSQPPSRPAVRQRTVSCHSLEPPRISHASLTALRRLLSTHASSVPSPCPWLPGPSASQPAPILPVRRRPHASRNAHMHVSAALRTIRHASRKTLAGPGPYAQQGAPRGLIVFDGRALVGISPLMPLCVRFRISIRHSINSAVCAASPDPAGRGRLHTLRVCQ